MVFKVLGSMLSDRNINKEQSTASKKEYGRRTSNKSIAGVMAMLTPKDKQALTWHGRKKDEARKDNGYVHKCIILFWTCSV